VLEADANLDLARRVREPLERLVAHSARRDEGDETHRRMVSTVIRLRQMETTLRGQRDALGANMKFYERRRETYRRGRNR
jgi:hypothetical protein